MNENRMRLAAAIFLVLSAVAAVAGPVRSVYDPDDYTTGFGALTVGGGDTLTITTGWSSPRAGTSPLPAH